MKRDSYIRRFYLSQLTQIKLLLYTDSSTCGFEKKKRGKKYYKSFFRKIIIFTIYIQKKFFVKKDQTTLNDISSLILQFLYLMHITYFSNIMFGFVYIFFFRFVIIIKNYHFQYFFINANNPFASLSFIISLKFFYLTPISFHFHIL